MHRCLLNVRPAPWRSLTLAWVTGCMLLGGTAHAAAAWVPARDSEVVEVLRERPLSAQEKAWRTLRADARAKPGDVALAVAVASQAIQWARQDGDPRLLGQAQAALGHWWTQPSPPPEVRLLRATILQSTHDFDAALRDLRALVQLPARARVLPAQRVQAWLTLASVLLVTGQYDEAQRACDALVQVQASWHAQACSLEMRQADAYTEGAYADLLLDQGKPAEVLTLLKGRERNDALLLRLAEAGAAVNDPANDGRVSALRARFAAARERGDSVHRREEARFTLRLLQQPAQALKLAQRNWAVQKEPADARILLEAARAAGAAQVTQEVRDFMQRWGWRDQRLEGLL